VRRDDRQIADGLVEPAGDVADLRFGGKQPVGVEPKICHAYIVVTVE
jgi:hypothetical protein